MICTIVTIGLLVAAVLYLYWLGAIVCRSLLRAGGSVVTAAVDAARRASPPDRRHIDHAHARAPLLATWFYAGNHASAEFPELCCLLAVASRCSRRSARTAALSQVSAICKKMRFSRSLRAVFAQCRHSSANSRYSFDDTTRLPFAQ
jgi:hypothetical protein